MQSNDRNGPTDPAGAASGVSRRSFIQTLGMSAAAGAVSDAVLAEQATAVDGAAPVFGPEPGPVILRVNGQGVQVTLDPATTLLQALRLNLNITGCKEVCDRGACGACSVLVDGTLTASCMMLATDAVGATITTVEGLAKDETLDEVQRAFVEHDALQCGYCTPGLIMASRALLNENRSPSEAQICRGLSGNICRCGTYTNVVNAVLSASGQPVPVDCTSESFAPRSMTPPASRSRRSTDPGTSARRSTIRPVDWTRSRRSPAPLGMDATSSRPTPSSLH